MQESDTTRAGSQKQLRWVLPLPISRTIPPFFRSWKRFVSFALDPSSRHDAVVVAATVSGNLARLARKHVRGRGRGLVQHPKRIQPQRAEKWTSVIDFRTNRCRLLTDLAPSLAWRTSKCERARGIGFALLSSTKSMLRVIPNRRYQLARAMVPPLRSR